MITVKQQIAAELARKGKIILADTALTDSCVRAVAELVFERKARDEYPADGTLHLIVTRRGVFDDE